MDTILFLLFLFSFFSLLIGLIKPTIFNKLFKREMTRKKVLAYFGGAIILIIIILPSDQQNNVNQELKKTDNSPKIVEDRPDKSGKPQEVDEKDRFDRFDNPPIVEEVKEDKEINPMVEDNEPIIGNSAEDSIHSFHTETPIQENDNNLVYYQVDRVVDGDTVRVLIDEVSYSVRLIGINTPETVDPRKPVECMGFEASEAAKRQLDGKKVALEVDPSQGDKDKYDRLIRYVILEDGTNFNKWMILEGYAYEYTYDIPYKYQTEFKQAQATAEANKKGLWADGVCDDFMEIPKEEITKPNPIEETDFTDLIQEQYDCSANVYNCSNFKTHAEAQSAFDYCMSQVGSDIHRLDGDDNGIACESLP